MKKIVIQYPFIAQYRMPIFKLLSNSSKYHYEFWADVASKDKFLITDIKGLNLKRVELKHLEIPVIKKEFEWQPHAIKNILHEHMDCYIVLGNVNSISTWICSAIARIRGIPVLMWSHGYLENETGLKNLIRKTFYKLANGFLLYGNIARNIMIKKGFNSEHLHVIYNSLDYETQKSFRDKLTYQDRLTTRKKLGINSKSILLIAIGRIMAKLKLKQAITAIKRQTNTGKNATLLIIGDGPEKKSLVEYAKSLDISKNIIFYGACHNEKDISYLYNASDYSIVMGKVGLSAMHSLAYGIPMITNDNTNKHFPEIEAIVENETGWYFRENDIDDFCSKLKPIEYRGTYYSKCIKVIETYFNPSIQKNFIETAISNYCKE